MTSSLAPVHVRTEEEGALYPAVGAVKHGLPELHLVSPRVHPISGILQPALACITTSSQLPRQTIAEIHSRHCNALSVANSDVYCFTLLQFTLLYYFIDNANMDTSRI